MTRYVKRTLLVAAIGVLSTIGVASAQSQSAPRWLVNVDGGYQTNEILSILTDPLTFTLYAEQGEVLIPFTKNDLPSLDVRAGVRLWRNLGVALGYSRFVRNYEAEVTVRTPHPFFFNRHRVFTQPTDLRRTEETIHLQAQWTLPITSRFDVTVFGGPSLFLVKQELLGLLTREEYPFETPPVTGVVRGRRKESPLGFSVGADVAAFFTDHVGVGYLMRFSRATGTFTSFESGILVQSLGEAVTFDTKFGGFTAAGGLRLRF